MENYCASRVPLYFLFLSLQCRRILASEVASERILFKRGPSWIQTQKRLGERRKCVQGVGVRLRGEVTGRGEGKEKDFFVHFAPPPPYPLFQANMAVNLRSRAPQKTHALQATSFWVTYKMERECASRLEMASKLTQVILQRKKWNLFWGHTAYVEIETWIVTQHCNCLKTKILWRAVREGCIVFNELN